MKKIFAILMMTLISSCQSDIKAKFEITNGTKKSIDSINIKSTDHQKNSEFIVLEQGQLKNYWLDMNGIPKVDGDYLLSFKRNNTKKIIRFGYFTNGYPSEKVTKIRIEKDTVLIEQIFKDY